VRRGKRIVEGMTEGRGGRDGELRWGFVCLLAWPLTAQRLYRAIEVWSISRRAGDNTNTIRELN